MEALFWFGFIPIITIDAFPQFYVNCYRKLRFQHYVFSLFLDTKLLPISLYLLFLKSCEMGSEYFWPIRKRFLSDHTVERILDLIPQQKTGNRIMCQVSK